MFAKMIKEEKGNMSMNLFADAVEINGGIIQRWLDGSLPHTQTYNRLVMKLGWSERKANNIYKWIEAERKRRKVQAKEEKAIKDKQAEVDQIKAYAFDQISKVVLRGSGSLSDIDLIVNETIEVIEEELEE